MMIYDNDFNSKINVSGSISNMKYAGIFL